MTKDELQKLAEDVGCPDCGSEDITVLFVPEPDDVAFKGLQITANPSF